MGNGLAKTWYSPLPKTKEGTSLKEIRIKHIRDAHDVIGMLVEDYTPVSLVPAAVASHCCCCCCCCWAEIPQGFTALVTRFGKDVVGSEEDGSWSPGCHCWLPWYKVSRLVTRQLIIFDAPVKNVKTKDDVDVHIDVLIDFFIFDAKLFVYKIGPEKLDDLMRATQEEVLRSMAGEIYIEDIYDLNGAAKQEDVDNMNLKLAMFGIKVHDFIVKNVDIPQDMAGDFEERTLFESKGNESKMQQKFDILDLDHDEEKSKLRESCDNERMAEEEKLVTVTASIRKEVRELEANNAKELNIKLAQLKADKEDAETSFMLEAATLQAQIFKLKMEGQGSVDKDVGKLEAEIQLYQVTKKAMAKMEALEKISEGKKAIAEAEGDAAVPFAARRAMEQEQARLYVLEKLAENKGLKIASTEENNTGLAPDNSLVAQVAQQGLEAFRMKLAEMTSKSAASLSMGTNIAGGLVRPVPQQSMS